MFGTLILLRRSSRTVTSCAAPPKRLSCAHCRPPKDSATVQPTDTSNPDYFHRVVDCQWACPAHTDVPEYIRLIANGQFSDAYMVNRESNVFPGILGRVCDRPCEPACRRGRVEDKPVAICRLKRVAADHKDSIVDRLPVVPAQKNGKRVACIGAGPASLTVANDLMPLGYEVVIFEQWDKPGGLMRTNIPAFRLPETRARRGDRLHHRHGRRDPLRLARRQPEAAARDRRLRRGVRRLAARPRARNSSCPAATKATRTSTSASSGSSRSRSSTSTRSASAC